MKNVYLCSEDNFIMQFKEKYYRFAGAVLTVLSVLFYCIIKRPPLANGFSTQFFPGSDFIDCNSKTELHKKSGRDEQIQATSANLTTWWVMLFYAQHRPLPVGDVSEERSNFIAD